MTTYHWIALDPMRLPRIDPTAAELPDGRVVVTGGSSYAARTDGHDEVWSPVDGAWQPSDVAMPRAQPAPAVTVRNRDGATTVGDGGRTVTLASPRLAPTVTRLAEHAVLVTGGFQQYMNYSWEDYDDSVENCEVVDFARGTTEPAGTLAHARHAHAAVRLRCGAVLLVGGNHDDDGATAETELGIPAGFTGWDAFGPALRDRLRARVDVLERKALLDRASRLREDKAFAAALALARDTAARWPDHAAVWADLGRSHAMLAEWSEAVIAYQRAVELEPDSAFDWGNLGACQLQAGRRDDARRAFETVVELTGDGDTWTQGLARHAHDQLQFLAMQRGERAAVAASTHRPTSSLQWNNKGVALLESGRPAEALPCFTAALRADRANHYAWHNKSIALAKLGRPAEAKTAVERAIALRAGADPALVSDAWIQRGIACYDLGQYVASVRSYDRALAARETPIAHGNRGNSLFKLGRAAAALAAYERAIALGHNAWWGVACACCALGRIDAARAAEAKALALDPSLAPAMRADPDLAPLRTRRKRKPRTRRPPRRR